MRTFFAIFLVLLVRPSFADSLERGAFPQEDGSVQGSASSRANLSDRREVKQLGARCEELKGIRDGKSVAAQVRGEIDTIAKTLLQLPPELFSRKIRLDSHTRLVDESTKLVLGSFTFGCQPATYFPHSDEYNDQNIEKLVAQTLKPIYRMSPRAMRYATYAEKALLSLLSDKIGTNLEETISEEDKGAVMQLCRDIIRLPDSLENTKLSLIFKPIPYGSWDLELLAPNGAKLGVVHLWVGEAGKFYTQIIYRRYPEAVKTLEHSPK